MKFLNFIACLFVILCTSSLTNAAVCPLCSSFSVCPVNMTMLPGTSCLAGETYHTCPTSVYSLGCCCTITTTVPPTTTVATTSTVSPCIEASANQTVQFNNTIDGLKAYLTAYLNTSLSNVCTSSNINALIAQITELDAKLTAFEAQTNNNFQTLNAVFNNVTIALDAVSTRLRRFQTNTNNKLDALERCCRRGRRDSSSH